MIATFGVSARWAHATLSEPGHPRPGPHPPPQKTCSSIANCALDAPTGNSLQNFLRKFHGVAIGFDGDAKILGVCSNKVQTAANRRKLLAAVKARRRSTLYRFSSNSLDQRSAGKLSAISRGAIKRQSFDGHRGE